MVAVAVATASVAALSAASVASSSASLKFSGAVRVAIKGWGQVTPGKGFAKHPTIACRHASCPSKSVASRQARVTLQAKAYKGWKLAGWHGACKGTRPTCAINLSREPVSGGVHRASVRAVFVAVAPGLSRANPIPLGQTADIGGGFEWRINSFTPAVQLSPSAPPGHQYAVANVTAIYVGGGGTTVGSVGRLVQQDFQVIGSSNVVYPWGQCPVGPEPDLSQDPTLLSPGQSDTGNVCWEIASNDAATLEAEIPYWNPSGATTWFALR
jgi:hypothetical protein